MQVIGSPRWGRAVVLGAAVVAITFGCGTDPVAQNGEPSDAVAPPPTTAAGSSYLDALYDCFTSHGIESQDPAQEFSPISAVTYPVDVAVEAWGDCKATYMEAMRDGIAEFNQVDAELPPEAAPLAFADCMATFGWVTVVGQLIPAPQVPTDYMEANAECKQPAQGESREASYCRFLNAIADRARHDSTMSVTGAPYTGTQESRLEAIVALYDEALQIAPDEMEDNLRTLKEAFEQGSPMPDSLWESMIDYHLSMCGAWVYLGSMD